MSAGPRPPDAETLAALERAAPGAVAARASDRLAMAHDASHYLLTPNAVVVPTSAEQVGRLMAAAASRNLRLTFRSGGTSLSGQAGSSGVLVDTRRHFRSIEVLDNGERVRAQPGATIRQVNARLARYGRKLGPDPASEIACTVGGVIANNSSGMSCGTEFNSYRTLESLVVILASGTVVDTGRPDADALLRHHEPALAEGLAALRRRVLDDRESLRTIERLFSMKNTMGYGLNALVDHDSPAQMLAHLVVGSEGTLGFVAEATFRTLTVKTPVATGLLVFGSLSAATEALPDLVACGFAAIELLDARSLTVAQQDPRCVDALQRIPVLDHAALLVEFQEEGRDELRIRQNTGRAVIEGLDLHFPGELSDDASIRAELWRIRKGLYATVAGHRPSGTTALLEDIAVPVAGLLDTCRSLGALFETYGYTDSVVFGHAKDGNVHFLVNEDFAQAGGVDRYARFTEDMVELVLGQQGTLKAEHGTGRIMAPYVRRQYGDELYEVMCRIKQLFDPGNVMNPGVLINEDPMVHLKNLKVSPAVEAEVDRCVECGYCEPACPSADLTLTPRQRIVLRRELAVLTEAGESALADDVRADYAYDGIQTCAVDGMCQTACPVAINTGDLVRRLRAEDAGALERHGWNQAAKHWGSALRAASVTMSLAHRLPAPAITTTTSWARKTFGAERIPSWNDRLPRGGAMRSARVTTADAVFFPACVSTIFGPAEEATGASAAFTELCRRAGVRLSTPASIIGLCCGTPWKSKGMLQGATKMSQRLLPALRDATQDGTLPVVCDASSCTEGLAAQLAEIGLRVVDVTAFVAADVLPRLTVIRRFESLVLHPTCSSNRIDDNAGLLALAEAIAGQVLVPDDWRCCAFAGDRGLLHPELTASATAPAAAQVRTLTASAYASTNRTCELAMTLATDRPYRQIIELVEEATRPA